MRDPAGLKIAGGTAREGKDEAIAFVVALNRAVSGTVTVDYATADEGIEPPLPEVVLDLVGQLPDVREPEGLRQGSPAGRG